MILNPIITYLYILIINTHNIPKYNSSTEFDVTTINESPRTEKFLKDLSNRKPDHNLSKKPLHLRI